MHETSLFQLPPVERAGRYRQLADEMRSSAGSAATEESRIGYLNMAVEWLEMADKLEAEHGKVSVIVDPELASLLRRSSSE
jgi:hypothetical protein